MGVSHLGGKLRIGCLDVDPQNIGFFILTNAEMVKIGGYHSSPTIFRRRRLRQQARQTGDPRDETRDPCPQARMRLEHRIVGKVANRSMTVAAIPLLRSTSIWLCTRVVTFEGVYSADIGWIAKATGVRAVEQDNTPPAS